MIAELKSQDFGSVLPLYRIANLTFPLISMVIQEQKRGQIFVDDVVRPNSAVVVAHSGYMFFLGADENRPFNRSLSHILETAMAIKPSPLLWYAPPRNWQFTLDALDYGRVRRRQKVRLDFCNFENWRPSIPPGFQLSRISPDLLLKTDTLRINLHSTFWQSAEEFVESSMGVCVLSNGEVASLCYATAVADGLAEMYVETLPRFRRRGLASLVAWEFIKRCLDRGIMPTWECFEQDARSVKLAGKLGFIETAEYCSYSFDIPMTFTPVSPFSNPLNR